VVLDAGSWKPVLDELLPLVDVAVAGAAFGVPGADDPLGALRDLGVGRAAVTAGAGPLRWLADGGTGEVRPPAVAAVDTLGAGDAFHGALAWALATRPEALFPDALGLAAAVAALRCSFPGQRAWLSSTRLAEVRTQWLMS
jgi:sugar/nucleoside kinase (ribokinase family)